MCILIENIEEKGLGKRPLFVEVVNPNELFKDAELPIEKIDMD